MTGAEMIKKALTLLGYTDSSGDVSGSERFKTRSIPVLNAIYSDLFYTRKSSGFVPLKSINDEIDLPERALNDVMPYGVASMLAQSEGDGDQQQTFVMLYNQKRNAMNNSGAVRDAIPFPE